MSVVYLYFSLFAYLIYLCSLTYKLTGEASCSGRWLWWSCRYFPKSLDVVVCLHLPSTFSDSLFITNFIYLFIWSPDDWECFLHYLGCLLEDDCIFPSGTNTTPSNSIHVSTSIDCNLSDDVVWLCPSFLTSIYL